MKRPRVLLADDHKIVLEGLRGILEPEFEIVGAVEDGRALVAETERLSPDVVVADISMPGLNGMDAARQIKKMDAHIKIVFLTIKEIGAILNISTRTAEFHKYRMMEQLKIKTSAELVKYAVKHGLVPA